MGLQKTFQRPDFEAELNAWDTNYLMSHVPIYRDTAPPLELSGRLQNAIIWTARISLFDMLIRNISSSLPYTIPDRKNIVGED